MLQGVANSSLREFFIFELQVSYYPHCSKKGIFRLFINVMGNAGLGAAVRKIYNVKQCYHIYEIFKEGKNLRAIRK